MPHAHDPIALSRQIAIAVRLITPVLEALDPHVETMVLIELAALHIAGRHPDHQTKTLELMTEAIAVTVRAITVEIGGAHGQVDQIAARQKQQH